MLVGIKCGIWRQLLMGENRLEKHSASCAKVYLWLYRYYECEEKGSCGHKVE